MGDTTSEQTLFNDDVEIVMPVVVPNQQLLISVPERRSRGQHPDNSAMDIDDVPTSYQPNSPWFIDTWQIPTTRLQWGQVRGGRTHLCPYCHIPLLTGEEPGFCCGPQGSHLNDVAPLPPMPPEYTVLLNDRRISSLSRTLNLVFSFASLETTKKFPDLSGPPGFMAIQGKVYHRVRPTHHNSAVRWLLYDGFMLDAVPHERHAARIPPTWISTMQLALIRFNPFAMRLNMLGRLSVAACPNAYLILEDTGASPEIAAIMSYDNTALSEIRARRLVFTRDDEQTRGIPTISRLWEPLAYPLFFPHGTLGWGVLGTHNDAAYASGNIDPPPPSDTPEKAATQMWHYRARLLREERFRIFGRLTNEYVVDMFTRNLESRLNYIRENQRAILEEDAQLMGAAEASVEDTQNIYLPSSFLGSNRWASEQIADSLALAAHYGPPTFFITMTCNSQWPEIQSELRPGQNHTDIPVVVMRVFRQKLSLLEQALKHMFPNAGNVLYIVHSVEFQRRGLPHAHILVKYAKSCVTPDQVDAVISAEIPSDPDHAALVRKWMVHGHSPNYCQKSKKKDSDGKLICRFGYPQPLRQHTTINDEGRVLYRRRTAEDQDVVPYCLPLLDRFRCHMNMEAAGSSHLFQYIFKYIHKGPDRVRYTIRGSNEQVDEIEDYWNARYLSAGEATWRILGFHITHKQPAVSSLTVHLEDSIRHRQYYRSNSSHEDSLSSLQRYFSRPIGAFTFKGEQREFDTLTYVEYYSIFRLQKHNPANSSRPMYFEESAALGGVRMHVVLRNEARPHVARLHTVRLSEGERFYLRTLLQHRAARSFLDLRTINGVICDSYQAAATELGLFATHNEAELAILEGIQTLRTPRQLRVLLCHLLVNDCVSTPRSLWDTVAVPLSYDFILHLNNVESLGINKALQELASYLEEYGKCLSDYGLPEPTSYSMEVEHELARWTPQSALLAERAATARQSFNHEQEALFTTIVDAVINEKSLLAFVDGKAGRGKTYLVNAICDHLRSLGHLVMPTATSGYAAQLYPGGRTTHSAFKVPVNENNEMLQSPVRRGSSRGELLARCSLFVWDEAPMVNKAVLACVDNVCRAVTGRQEEAFGGKVFVLLGDFRQTCPVIRGGTKAQIVEASIRSSPLWAQFTIYHLTIPIRNAEDPAFSAAVDDIGDGAGPDVDLALLQAVESDEELIDFVFPQDILDSPYRCCRRSILAPTNKQIDAYNHTVIARVRGQERTYFASDSLKEADDAGLHVAADSSILDYVTRQNFPGLPPHSLTMKTNAVYRLLRNFSLDRGLVKNVRVVVTHTGARLVSVKILRPTTNGIADDEAEEDLLIPRISFHYHLKSGHTLLRSQFPLAPAYATTFNSCQGLTLDRVGVDLTHPVFSHGQLYTALSRIWHRSHARILLDSEDRITTNVTYTEILL